MPQKDSAEKGGSHCSPGSRMPLPQESAGDAVGVAVAVGVGVGVGVGGCGPASVGVASVSATPNRIRLQQDLVSRFVTVIPPAFDPTPSLFVPECKSFRDRDTRASGGIRSETHLADRSQLLSARSPGRLALAANPRIRRALASWTGHRLDPVTAHPSTARVQTSVRTQFRVRRPARRSARGCEPARPRSPCRNRARPAA
jgi:hypothetical protein